MLNEKIIESLLKVKENNISSVFRCIKDEGDVTNKNINEFMEGYKEGSKNMRLHLSLGEEYFTREVYTLFKLFIEKGENKSIYENGYLQSISDIVGVLKWEEERESLYKDRHAANLKSYYEERKCI